MPKSTGRNRRDTRPIYPTLTPRGGQALALVVADMRARGEKFAHTSGAVDLALVNEAARRGFPLPEESTPQSPEETP